MLFHTVLIGRDGFTKEEEKIYKEDIVPNRVHIRNWDGLTRRVDPYEFPKERDRTFYLITTFYAAGKNFAVYKEIQ